MSKEEAWDALCAAFIKERCGDSSCIFGCGGGMHTNGGCRTSRDSPVEIRRCLQRLANEWRYLSSLVEGRTKDAYFCYAENCGDAKLIDLVGRKVCHNPLHHKKRD